MRHDKFDAKVAEFEGKYFERPLTYTANKNLLVKKKCKRAADGKQMSPIRGRGGVDDMRSKCARIRALFYWPTHDPKRFNRKF